jgi:hypothetical protein
VPDDPGVIWRVSSVVGMLLLVGAYLVNQRGGCKATSSRYLGANALGSGMLAAYSWRIDELVFVGLEGFWCVATLAVLAKARREGLT